MIKSLITTFLIMMMLSSSINALAQTSSKANADVIAAKARQTAPGVWSFSVTVFHPDTGWEDYADGWDIVLADGSVVKPNPGETFSRTLWHPHVDEQPFTRSQSGVLIPAGIRLVTIRAHDKRDGFGGKTISIELLE